jgi:hypothetical protein
MHYELVKKYDGNIADSTQLKILQGYKQMSARIAGAILLWLLFLLLSSDISAANRYWVASSAGYWNNSANWSSQSGGSGGASVPGISDVVIFDGGGLGNCRINMHVNINGLTVSAGFSGVISVDPGVSVTTSGYYQLGGIFTGDNGDIYINGNFELFGGLFSATAIFEVNSPCSGVPSATIDMDFENSAEPFEVYEPPRLPNSSNSGNGCLEGREFNQYYAYDVCIAPSVPQSHFALERSTDFSRSGDHSLRFYLQASPLNPWPIGEASHRVELSPNYNSPISRYPSVGEERWYGISYFFPNDFIFAPENIANDIRFIISQWQHGTAGSAILAYEIMGDQIMLQRQTGSSTNSTWVTPDAIATIQKGQWMDFVMKVKWAKTGGTITIWVNGQQVYDNQNVQTVYNNLSVGGGFKFGVYYWRWKDKPSVQKSVDAGIYSRQIYIDEVKEHIGTNGYEIVSICGG